jgi:hypothetical protein
LLNRRNALRYGARPTDQPMLDLNNRPGGPNLIVTAKTAHKVHFLNAATLTMTATLDMPARPTSWRSPPTAVPPMAPFMATAFSSSASTRTGASL